MQNRRILNKLLLAAGHKPEPTLESDSMIALYAHVRTGRWASIMPARLVDTLGLTEQVRAIPIIEPSETHTIGLVALERDPTTPLITALITESRVLAKVMMDKTP
jgi:DNA-binding transcriptional LysR family regulator